MATLIALTGLLVVAVGLLLLMSAVLPHLSYAVLILLGLFALVPFHYVAWGYWLSRRLAGTVADEAEEDPYAPSAPLPDVSGYLDDETLADGDA